MAVLSTAETNNLTALRERIQFPGTEEMAYTDSGLWNFLPFVMTKDSHEKGNKIIKPIPVAEKDFLKIVFLFMLIYKKLLIPKSRQMMVSWSMSAFAVWHAMSAPYRHVVYQTKKEADAHAMVTEGRKNPAGGRMDFMLQHLPKWLKDDHFTSGNGNLVGNIIFNPEPRDVFGNPVPWSGSRIEAVPGGPDQVRGKTSGLICIDEGAFHEMLKKVIVACNPALDKGGHLQVVSSVDAGSDFNSIVLDTIDGAPPENKIPEIVQQAMDIMGIRWPRGMRTWETASGFQVLELHYTADPDKDPDRNGAGWVEAAAKGYPGGMESQGWRTEMEIEYDAGGGQKVFPFLSQTLSPVFVDSIDPSMAMARMNVFAGYDYGTNNPSAFVVWGLDDKGDLYALWELYEPCLDYVQHFNRIKMCPYFDKLEYIAADNKIFSKTQQTTKGLQAVSNLFLDNGIYISRARSGMDYPIAMRFLGEYWPGGKIGWDKIPPRAFITASCPNGKRELRGLRFQTYADRVAGHKSNSEKLVDKDNHWWDASAYAIDRKPGIYRHVSTISREGSIEAFIERANKTKIITRKRSRGGIVCA